MRSFTFTIPGQPKGKMRPKVTMQGGFAHAYTPKETTSYENYVRVMYQICKNKMFLDGAIRADIVAFFPIPKSTSKQSCMMIALNVMSPRKKAVNKIVYCKNILQKYTKSVCYSVVPVLE